MRGRAKNRGTELNLHIHQWGPQLPVSKRQRAESLPSESRREDSALKKLSSHREKKSTFDQPKSRVASLSPCGETHQKRHKDFQLVFHCPVLALKSVDQAHSGLRRATNIK